MLNNNFINFSNPELTTGQTIQRVCTVPTTLWTQQGCLKVIDIEQFCVYSPTSALHVPYMYITCTLPVHVLYTCMYTVLICAWHDVNSTKEHNAIVQSGMIRVHTVHTTRIFSHISSFIDDYAYTYNILLYKYMYTVYMYWRMVNLISLNNRSPTPKAGQRFLIARHIFF